jgi:thermitase
VALALAAPAAALEVPPAPTTPPTSFVPGQIVVVWEKSADRGDKLAAKRDAEVDSAVSLGDPRYQVVDVEPGQSTSDALAQLNSDPAVEVAERDALLSPTAIPNDPLFSQLWALKNNGPPGISGFGGAVAGDDINATSAWDLFTTGLPGAGTVVADIDSGYRFAGPDLGPVAWTNPGETPENATDDDADGLVDDVHGADFVGANAESPATDGDPTDDNLVSGGHGVHTAGTIGAAGNNGAGITGVAWDARIMPLRVCANAVNSTPPNSLSCPSSSIIAAIKYAAAHGARVANISLTSTSFSTTMRNAIAESPQVLFVISAGNDAQDNESKPHYPCNYEPKSSGIPGAIDNVICVAATNQADGLASFSDFGKTSVDLGAPGTETLSTYPTEAVLSENFQAADSGANWTAGSGGGFVRTSESPLTSFGFSDSPEESPVAGSERESTLTTPIAIPAGYGNCQLSGKRFVSLLGSEGSEGIFTQEVLANGSPVFTRQVGSTSGATLVSFATEAITGLAGTNVQLRFRYQAGPHPGAANGVWLDDLALTCYQATGVAPSYAFLQGTSMAAPQVSGTAALLFSLQPASSVTTVRNAILAAVDPVASLSGKTATGGRLDARKALDKLDVTPPAAPAFSSSNPASPNEASQPLLLGGAEAGSTVRIYTGAVCGGSPVAIGSAAQFASPGITVTVPHATEATFSAKAVDAAENVSPCSAPISYKQEDDVTAPLPPELATTPASPAGSASPRILGNAEPGSSVTIFASATCTGTVLATVSAATLASPGIGVTVPASSTAVFSALATDAAHNASACSAPVSYTNTGLIGSTPIAPLPPEPPQPPSGCTVPKLAGKTPAKAKSALSAAGCKLGRVTKPKPRAGQKPPALVVKSSSPRAGATSTGTVALALGPKPKARRG